MQVGTTDLTVACVVVVVGGRRAWRSSGCGGLHFLYVAETWAIIDAGSSGGINFEEDSHAKAQRRKEDRLSLAALRLCVRNSIVLTE